MIARAFTIAAIALAFAMRLSAQDADSLFDVSLSAVNAVDLSPVYQQRIREATDAFRGDLRSFAITARIITSRFSLGPTKTLDVAPEFLGDFDAFPHVPFTLSGKPEKITPRL